MRGRADWREQETVEIACEIVHETDRAYAVVDGTVDPTDYAEEALKWFWVPKSLCEWQGTVMVMPEWLAKERGLI